MSRERGLISRDVNFELVQESMYRCAQLERSSLDTSVFSMIKVKTLLQPVRSIALIGQLRISIVVSADNSEISMLASWLSITCRYCNCFTPFAAMLESCVVSLPAGSLWNAPITGRPSMYSGRTRPLVVVGAEATYAPGGWAAARVVVDVGTNSEVVDGKPVGIVHTRPLYRTPIR